jgi:transposase
MGFNSEFIRINPLNTELNPICHLLALLGAHHILHISRIRVKILVITDSIKEIARNGRQWTL